MSVAFRSPGLLWTLVIASLLALSVLAAGGEQERRLSVRPDGLSDALVAVPPSPRPVIPAGEGQKAGGDPDAAVIAPSVSQAFALRGHTIERMMPAAVIARANDRWRRERARAPPLT